MTRVYLVYETTDRPTGGGNQFLRGLRIALQRQGALAEDAERADVFLFNSHQHLDEVLRLKKRYPDRVFVQRIDGPMRLYNAPSDRRDTLVDLGARHVADGCIFQSEWSRQANYGMGLYPVLFSTVIPNAADPALFFRPQAASTQARSKTRLIAASWSANPGKGFDVFAYLDRHLDWERFEMTFVGRSPIAFERIRHVPPVPSAELAALYREHDIFVFASRIEACSNGLIEALSCGLPVVAPRSSSNPELVGAGGELYDRPEDVAKLICRIADSRDEYASRIAVPSIEAVSLRYLEFMDGLTKEVREGRYRAKRLAMSMRAAIRMRLMFIRLLDRFPVLGGLFRPSLPPPITQGS